MLSVGIFLAAVLSIIYAAILSPAGKSTGSFSEFCTTLFREEMKSNTMNLHFTLKDPKAAGIDSYEITLGSLSGDSPHNQARQLKKLSEELKKYSHRSLKGKDRLTCRLLSDYISRQQNLAAYPYYDEPLKNIVLFMGRLSYADKRVDRLIDIWNILKGKTAGWQLIIVGEGDEKKKLEAYVKKLNLTNVEFAGFCNNPKQYYDRASILCLTSSFEGWGLVLTEAQANGIVPIAFECSDGVKSILSPNEINGLLIPPFDLEAYAKKLLFVMNNTEARKRIQKNVIEKSKSYSPEVIGEKWIELLNTIGHKS